MTRPSPEEVLSRLDGAARAQDLVALCGAHAVRRAFAEGRIRRVARGRYALPACADPWLAALRISGVVSHQSAAQLIGLDLLRAPDAPHVTVRRGRHHVTAVGAHLHWADLGRHEVDERARVTAPVRTVLDLCRSLSFAEALAATDSALRRRLVTPSALASAAAALRGGGRARIQRVIALADSRAGSVLESALRALLIANSVAGFVPQWAVQDGPFLARVDLAHPGLRIVLEADSFEYHGTRAALVRDCRRYDELTVRGWLVLRFAWEHVMFEPEWVIDTIGAAMSCRSRRSTRGQMSTTQRVTGD